MRKYDVTIKKEISIPCDWEEEMIYKCLAARKMYKTS